MARRGQATSQPPQKKKATAPPATAPAAGAVGGAGSAAAVVSSLTLAFATMTGAWLIAACRRILIAAGVSLAIITFLIGFAFTRIGIETPFEVGPAEKEQMRLAAAYRAYYIVNAVDRLEKAEKQGADALARAEQAEAHYFALHLRAVSNRLTSARMVDQAARRWGDLLGWKAVMDNRTTAECRAANGRNFHATREPLIGWPGAVHPHCRCFPVGPFPGAPVIPSV